MLFRRRARPCLAVRVLDLLAAGEGQLARPHHRVGRQAPGIGRVHRAGREGGRRRWRAGVEMRSEMDRVMARWRGRKRGQTGERYLCIQSSVVG